ncbi:MAG: arginine--tRNA ligase [Patescibacteria group bacterium]
MIRNKIIEELKRITGANDIQLSFPEREEHGDFTTNVALVAAKDKGKNPREYAHELVKSISQVDSLMQIISEIKIEGPGFINFYLKEKYLVKILESIDESYGKTTSNVGQKVMFEYGQPNTHKLPHIGHLFSYVYGEAMTRILEATGWKVMRVNYQGDIGPHVAKALWALQKRKPVIPNSAYEKAKLLQRMYQEGSKAYDDGESAKAEIDDLNKKIYAHNEEVFALWQETRGWSLDYYQEFEKRLGINYDKYYFESQVGEEGKKKVKKHTPGIFKESEGAIIFEGSKYGLHDRVFVTKFDTPTYEAKDYYLEQKKFEDWPCDLVIITTANEQNEYFKVVFKALEKTHPGYVGKLKHIGFGMINLKSGKMSSRTGNIISGAELVDVVITDVAKLGNNNETSEMVGIGAIKYSFLKNNPLQNTAFDIQESISIEGNSGPYIQYTFARTQSVLAKSNLQGETLKVNNLEVEELSVVKYLIRFPEVVANAAQNYSPNLVANYLFELAQKYNTFYNKHKIIGGEKEQFRLLLTAATGQVLKNGLELLGIEAPKKM